LILKKAEEFLILANKLNENFDSELDENILKSIHAVIDNLIMK
jgi:hypothetical protein